MAIFAQVNNENIVTQVLVTDDNDPKGDRGHGWLIENLGGKWIETFIDGSERNKYAGVADLYDSAADVFYAPSPFNSWLLDKSSFTWKAPVLPPDSGVWSWSEESLEWVE